MEAQRGDSRPGEAYPDEAILLRIERAHRRIGEFVSRQSADTETLSLARALLETLPDLLPQHFADEEGPGGLFEELRAICPTVASDLEFLQRDHREILRALEALAREVEEVDREEPPERGEKRLARIRRDAAALLRMVRRHERAEAYVIADTYYMEEGGSG